MRTSRFAVLVIPAFVAASALAIHAQAPAPANAPATAAKLNPPRTADGKPDMQGYWTNATYTPVERPAEFKDQEFFTVAQAQEYAKKAQDRFLSQPDDDPHYDNSIWMVEKGLKGVSTLRTSIVIDPADGRIPPVNAQGRKRAEERAAARKRVDVFASAQNRGISERCIYWGHEGPPLMPTGYNSNLQIWQSPGEFVVIPEMMPVARVVPLDGRAHVSAAIRSIRGDSRGWWDGDTMVIETTNFTDRTAFRGSSEHLKVTERFTLVDAKTIRYQFTVEDPHTWDRPWKGEYPMTRIDEPIYEYACHEGNYGMPNILKAQRAVEAQERNKAATTSSSQP
jgi:hypothetical protein